MISLPLRTERLTIDACRPEDIPALVGVHDDPEAARYQAWTLPYTADDAARLVSAGQLALRAGGVLVGDAMVDVPAHTPHLAELGITVGRAHQGRGYAAEAVRALVDAVFGIGLVKVIAYVDTRNTASLALFDRVGFRREGLLHHSYRRPDGELVDEVLFGLTADGRGAADGAAATVGRPMRFDLIGLDADDTLWHSEDGFQDAEARFEALVSPHVDPAVDVLDHLVRVEGRNMALFGYGVKGFTLSMVECAIELSGGSVPGEVVQRIIDEGRRLLERPVRLLPGVAQAVVDLASDHRIVVITKGDLLHQEMKLAHSGLEDHLHGFEVVSEKDPASYARVLERLGVAPGRFLMVGNSVKSDVLPVLAIGGHAVHVPYHVTWEHEQVDHDGEVVSIESLADLRAWIDAGR